jgi:hypothetical protein
VRRLTESEFLERTPVGLGIEEVDEDEFEEDPAAVDGEELPVEGLQGYGVDVVGEETADLPEDLLDSNATAALGVGEELDEEG